jgi:hypothetical protein
VIGAAAGLGGGLLALRSERKKAHRDRIWQQQSGIYLILYRWTIKVNDYFTEGGMLHALASNLPDEAERAGATGNPFDDPRFLSEDDRARVWVHGSAKVRDAFNRIEDLQHEMISQARKDPGAALNRDDLLAATRALQAQIRSEMATE